MVCIAAIFTYYRGPRLVILKAYYPTWKPSVRGSVTKVGWLRHLQSFDIINFLQKLHLGRYIREGLKAANLKHSIGGIFYNYFVVKLKIVNIRSGKVNGAV